MGKADIFRQQAAKIRAGYLQEYRETVTMLKLARKKDKSHADRHFIQSQSKDIVRMGLMTGIVALPGGIAILAAAEAGLRRFNRTLMPSAFAGEEDTGAVNIGAIRLIAIRHGESEANVGQFINDDPSRQISLTEKGRDQATRAGVALKDVQFDAVYVSEFPRAQQTAALILAGRQYSLNIDARINERISGMDGRHVDEFNDLVRSDPENIQPPKGESFRQQMGRVNHFMDDLKQRHPHNSTILVVSHQDPIMAMQAAMGMDPQTAALSNLGNCEWVVLDLLG